MRMPIRRLARLMFLSTLVAAFGTGLARAGYDETRDGRADLMAALSEAQRSGRLVLVLVGGEWCTSCRELDAAIESSPRMQALLRDRFLLQKVNYSARNKNKPAIDMLPFFIGYPAAFVLDGKGRAVDMPSIHGFLQRGKVDLEGYADALEGAARTP